MIYRILRSFRMFCIKLSIFLKLRVFPSEIEMSKHAMQIRNMQLCTKCSFSNSLEIFIGLHELTAHIFNGNSICTNSQLNWNFYKTLNIVSTFIHERTGSSTTYNVEVELEHTANLNNYTRRTHQLRSLSCSINLINYHRLFVLRTCTFFVYLYCKAKAKFTSQNQTSVVTHHHQVMHCHFIYNRSNLPSRFSLDYMCHQRWV